MSDHKALLIDANPRIRAVVAAHLRRRKIEVVEVTDGVAAAKALREETPTFVMVDHGVPMGGEKTARLLRLHPRHQRLPFLLLLPASAPDVVDPGFCCLRRPCSGQQLDEAVDACLRMTLEGMTIDEVRREIAAISHLPVLSAAHRKILGLLGQEESEIDIPEVVRTIESDQGLTTAVLRVCNSAYYGFRGNSIDLAITFLGVDKVRAIVQAAIVFEVFNAEGGGEVDEIDEQFSLLALWKHAVACGVVMEEGGHRVKGRDHFIAGMLHDVGKVVLLMRFPDHAAEIRRMVVEEGRAMRDAEYELLGFTHADIGYELARRWDLPPTISTCIAFHHYPGKALQHRRLSALVHTADIAVRMMDIGYGGDTQIPALDESARPIARHVMAVIERKEQVEQEVDSMVAEYALSRGARPAKEAAA